MTKKNEKKGTGGGGGGKGKYRKKRSVEKKDVDPGKIRTRSGAISTDADDADFILSFSAKIPDCFLFLFFLFGLDVVLRHQKNDASFADFSESVFE